MTVTRLATCDPVGLQMLSDGPLHASLAGSPPAPFKSPLEQSPRNQLADSKYSKSSGAEVSKRTKASRACDECRRKKIRCDIEAGAQICLPCQRMGTVCAFSRVQLKRGPSKRIRSYSDGTQTQVRSAQLPGINALLSWSNQNMGMDIPTPNQRFPDSLNTGKPLSPRSPQHSPSFPDSPSSSSLSSQTFGNVSPAMGSCFSMGRPAMQLGAPGFERRASHSTPAHAPMSTLAEAASLADNIAMITEIDSTILSDYYRFCHPVFPVLPDTPEQLQEQLGSAPSGRWLVAAINGSVRAVPVDPMVSGDARAMQLMALVFLYLHTHEFTWLGAAFANALALTGEQSRHGRRLFHVLQALDKLHSAIYGTVRLVNSSPTAEDSAMPLTLWALGWPYPAPSSHMEPAIQALRYLVKLGVPGSRAELARLYPALTKSPVQSFVQVVLSH